MYKTFKQYRKLSAGLDQFQRISKLFHQKYKEIDVLKIYAIYALYAAIKGTLKVLEIHYGFNIALTFIR